MSAVAPVPAPDLVETGAQQSVVIAEWAAAQPLFAIVSVVDFGFEFAVVEKFEPGLGSVSDWVATVG